MPPDRLEEVTESLTAFQVAEAEWRQAHKDHELATLQFGVSKKRAAFKVNYKRAVGIRFLAWRAAAGKDSKSKLKDLFARRPTSLTLSLCLDSFRPGAKLLRTAPQFYKQVRSWFV